MERARRKATSDEHASAQISHRRLPDRRQRRRQEHPDRPPAVRQPGHPGRPARRAGARAPAQPGRPVAAHRRPGSRTRAGHHHRRGLPLLRHQDAQVHHRRRPRPRAVHPQHGDGRRRQRRRRGAGRHHQARPDAARPVPLLPQTRRHSCWRSCCACPIVFAINKIDAVDAPGEAFRQGAARAAGLCPGGRHERGGHRAGVALRGDNVTQPLAAPWYHGPSLLQVLEGLPTTQERSDAPLSLPVQYVQRRAKARARVFSRACSGAAWPTARARWATRCRCSRAASAPGGRPAARRRRGGQRQRRAVAGLMLDRQLDVSRGDWILSPGSACAAARFPATLAWLDTEPARAGPQVLGAPRQPLGAGAHHRHRLRAGHPHPAAA
jgi:hypothetical protein